MTLVRFGERLSCFRLRPEGHRQRHLVEKAAPSVLQERLSFDEERRIDDRVRQSLDRMMRSLDSA